MPGFFKPSATISYGKQIAKIVNRIGHFYQTNDTCWYSATQLLTLAQGNVEKIKAFSEMNPKGPIIMGRPWLDHIKKFGFQSVNVPNGINELNKNLKNYGPLVFVTDPHHESGVLHVVNIVGISHEKILVLDNKKEFSSADNNPNHAGFSYSLTFSEFINLIPKEDTMPSEVYFDIPKGLRPQVFDSDTGKLLSSAELARKEVITLHPMTHPFYYLPGLVARLLAPECLLDMDTPSHKRA